MECVRIVALLQSVQSLPLRRPVLRTSYRGGGELLLPYRLSMSMLVTVPKTSVAFAVIGMFYGNPVQNTYMESGVSAIRAESSHEKLTWRVVCKVPG